MSDIATWSGIESRLTLALINIDINDPVEKKMQELEKDIRRHRSEYKERDNFMLAGEVLGLHQRDLQIVCNKLGIEFEIQQYCLAY